MRVLHGTAALSGLLAALALPDHGLAWLGWVAWAPWLAALARGPGALDGAVSGAVHSLALHAGACWWMVQVMVRHGELSWPLALVSFGAAQLILCPWSVLLGAVAGAATRRLGPAALLAVPFGAAALDAARSRLALGFPWALPGMTQSDTGLALGLARLGGVHAVSAAVLTAAVVVALAGHAAVGLRRPATRRSHATAGAALLAASGLALLLLAGSFARTEAPSMPSPSAVLLPPGVERPWPTPRDVSSLTDALPAERADDGRIGVALIQGSAPQEVVLSEDVVEELRRARRQLALTDFALDMGAELVVWSESGHPGSIQRMPWVTREAIRRLAQERAVGETGVAGETEATGDVAAADVPRREPEILMGAIVRIRPPVVEPEALGGFRDRATNSALLLDADGLAGRYDKENLVPFGEYVPFARLFFWFERLVGVVGDLDPGASHGPIVAREARLGTVVCYEAVLAHHVASHARAGATVLVNITNDGWFHGTPALEQHLAFCRFRAAETGRPLLRCANSGITAVVSPSGRVVGRLGEGTRGVLFATVEPHGGPTPYLVAGDLPVAVAGILSMVGLLVAASRRRAAGAPGSGSRGPVDGALDDAPEPAGSEAADAGLA